MKSSLLLTLLVGTFVSVQAYAQNTPATEPATANTRRERMAAATPEQRAERQTEQMTKQLSLSADQKPTVAAINLKYAQANQKLLTSGDRDRNAMRQTREDMEGELKAVLSKEQFQQYETMREAQRNRMRQRNNR